jgi:hypothetical protein
MPPGRPSMGKNDIFFDSGALSAGITSAQGTARALLLLAEDEKIQITVTSCAQTRVQTCVQWDYKRGRDWIS